MLKNHKQIKSAMRDSDISSAFRERLMLAVTSVNDCRYCSYYHTQLALQEGINMILHMIRMGNYSGNAVDMIRAKMPFAKKHR